MCAYFRPEPLQNIRLSDDGRAVILLDQTALPGEVRYLTLSSADDFYNAIYHLRVRGAPAIGIFAGYAFYVLAMRSAAPNDQEFIIQMEANTARLASSRPTAVNLRWALDRMMLTARRHEPEGREAMLSHLLAECRAIHKEDAAMCRSIAGFGLGLLHSGDGVLTHCNAGPLATSSYGTALGPMILGAERGMKFHVFADETRPLLQGARLTAFELDRAGVDVTLICDNMASIVMKNGWVDACFVGCDRVAANGDTANKIGTSGVAILAKYYDIPFYVLGPTSTIDLSCKNGEEIPIELRDPEEIRSKFYTAPMAPESVKCYNPAFDVTDHSLITAIVTERGICRPPYTSSLAALFGDEKEEG